MPSIKRTLDVLSARMRDLAEHLPGRRSRILPILTRSRRDPLPADEIVVALLQLDRTAGLTRRRKRGGLNRGHSNLSLRDQDKAELQQPDARPTSAQDTYVPAENPDSDLRSGCWCADFLRHAYAVRWRTPSFRGADRPVPWVGGLRFADHQVRCAFAHHEGGRAGPRRIRSGMAEVSTTLRPVTPYTRKS